MDKEINKLYDAGNVDRAIHLLVKKIDAHLQNVDNYLQLSTYLLEQGSADQAQKLLEEAMHLVKKPQELYYNLAICYYMQGEYEKALGLLDQIPNDDLTLYQKALVYQKIGQNQKALAFALTIKNRDAKTLELIGDIWLSMGNFEEAQKNYLSIAEEEKTAKVYFLLGVASFENDRDQAEKYFDKSKSLDAKYYSKAKQQYGNLLGLISGKEKNNG
ncbi:tetratricopeptide repeat protein [Lactobacillus kalixensis]|uniref:Tetratricopeptide repeat protein n=1 Tax=Lactobacillus kalixensis DSM 16043 TaxID=1423763 RepID=A0A0R1UEM8_9LACO|nr:tetratricopeptide repeat protein [Lactobacillus kalixensis]KRL91332.1 hypothetical protein FC46_GL000631 [Lactobacillus kalixensis DSM 16043]